MSKAQSSMLADEFFLSDEPKLSIAYHFRLLQSFLVRKSKYLLFLADTLFLYLALSLAVQAKTEMLFVGLVFLMLVWGIIGYVRNTYAFVLVEDAEVIVKRSIQQFLTFLMVGSISYSILLNEIFNAKAFYVALLGFGGILMLSRILFLSIRKKYKNLLVKKRQIAIIGNNIYSNQLESYFNEGFSDYQVHSHYELSAVNFYSNENNPYSDIYYMAKRGINEIYCCFSSLSKKDIQQLLKEADRYMIRVKLLPDFYSVFNRPVRIEPVGDVPVLTIRPEPLLSDRNKYLKRCFDIVFSLAVIVFILSWFMPIIWLIIRLESKGPLFFKQKRSGLDNRSFYCYKFRSMTAGNATSDSQQATKNDKRITKVGAFLRKTSLDELPQFINVLMGNMSVVGPRPHMLAHTDQYRKLVDAYMIRHYVKPGITGLAQVSGCRGETKEVEAMQRRVEHDVVYVESWTFLLDLKIIFLTVWNIIRGEENAY